MRRWQVVPHFVRRRLAATDTARRHLERSRADRPAVEEMRDDLQREYARNNFSRRVDASLRGRRT